MHRALFALCLLLGAVAPAAAVDRAKTMPSPDANAASEAKSTSAPASSGEATVPTMQSSHVAMLSNAFAAKRIGAFNYQVTSVVYEAEPGSRLWTLHYVLGPAPDGSQPDPAEFDVLVDDRTGKPRFAEAR